MGKKEAPEARFFLPHVFTSFWVWEGPGQPRAAGAPVPTLA